MALEILLLVAFAGAFLVYLAGRISSGLRNLLSVGILAVLLGLIASLYGQSLEKAFYSGFLGLEFVLRLNMLSWFFALTVAGIGLLSIIIKVEKSKCKMTSQNLPLGRKLLFFTEFNESFPKVKFGDGLFVAGAYWLVFQRMKE